VGNAAIRERSPAAPTGTSAEPTYRTAISPSRAAPHLHPGQTLSDITKATTHPTTKPASRTASATHHAANPSDKETEAINKNFNHHKY